MIIGIHGLANKPEPETLRESWKSSIEEGLRRNCGIGNPNVPFDMVYWADALYANAKHTKPEYPFDDLFDHQPYKSAEGDGPLPEHEDSIWDEFRSKLSDFTGNIVERVYKADILGDASDWVVKRVSFTRDLHLYYENPSISLPGGDRKVRDILHDRLKEKLEEHKQQRLILISHSMGTIVAYNVLRDIGLDKRENAAPWQSFECPYLVTMGSPLGLGKVKEEIIAHRQYDPEADRLRTPSVVTKDWTNFSDPKDPISVDTHLGREYVANGSNVRVRDDLVTNAFLYGEGDDKKPNHHKSYGYLRTPEMSRHIAKFLGLN